MTSLQRHKSDGSNAKRRETTLAHRKRKTWAYLVMWEFQVRAGMEKRFEKAYGSDGDWVRFFRRNESYITTELIHASQAGRTYVTLDYWTSQEAYEDFRKQHLGKYETLDQKCQELTESEREIGRFVRVSGK
jgi:heme-degrading monooxygenase HmoA